MSAPLEVAVGSSGGRRVVWKPSMRSLLRLATLLVALPASAVEFEWVYVGDPGNPGDVISNCYFPNCGSLPYEFAISKYEVTNAQYAAFLNAVDASGSNTLGLYSTDMGADALFGGIRRDTGNPAGAK
jgi:formylglycine-generating enzyme required for sulfatase activity